MKMCLGAAEVPGRKAAIFWRRSNERSPGRTEEPTEAPTRAHSHVHACAYRLVQQTRLAGPDFTSSP